MHPADIQAALKKKNVTQKALAMALGVAPITLSYVINGKGTSDHIMKAVAKVIEQPVQFVFPDYYGGPPARSTSKAIGKDDRDIVAELRKVVNG